MAHKHLKESSKKKLETHLIFNLENELFMWSESKPTSRTVS